MKGENAMNKNTFYVIEIIENETGKTAARAETVPNKYNLLGYFNPARGFSVLSVNACSTLKKAQEIAAFWNEEAKAKNRFLYA